MKPRFDTRMVGERVAGVLLHVTSLPGEAGLGPDAFRFVDFLAENGFSAWQMLPVGPLGPGNSPYASRSAFAGEPLLISLRALADEGLLDGRMDLEQPGSPDRYDYEAAHAHREPMLRAACREFLANRGQAELDAFEAENPWLTAYARYAALRELSGEPWWTWPERFFDGKGAAPSAGTTLAEEVRYRQFLQVTFARQWEALHRYARTHGVALYGDLPIFVDLDSADVWANQNQFKLDNRGRPLVVAGVPPDLFSETGQRWGNPHYDWARMREHGYDWWAARMRTTFERFDRVRIDHFRGFEAAWEIPAAAETAVQGEWAPGPGARFFQEMERTLGELPIMVEDLGIITDDVRRLRDELGYPGMAVLQFAFGDDERNPYLPANHIVNEVVFTGTHDNDTTRGWVDNASDRELGNLWRFLGLSAADAPDGLLEAALQSRAETAIVPMQDILGLGSEARMNRPGQPDGNWEWRFTWDQLSDGRADWVRSRTRESGRERVVARL